jgi:uncharacterized protein YecA (UPF0149 family)
MPNAGGMYEEYRNHRDKRRVKDNYIHNKYDRDYESQPVEPSNKIGRNEPCPCGSGKKYKRCCNGL